MEIPKYAVPGTDTIYNKLQWRYTVVFCNIPSSNPTPRQFYSVGIRQTFWTEAGNRDLPWCSFHSPLKLDNRRNVGLITF